MKGKTLFFTIALAVLAANLFFPALYAEAEAEVVVARKEIKHPVPTNFVEKKELEFFPCNDCHDGAGNPKQRELVDEHDTIKLKHAEEDRWCLDCHDLKKRNFFAKANGDLVPFDQSYRLCGQCHGTIFRDWKAGIHGKRIGSWNGDKQYFQCVNCHDPHNPRFKPLKPEPAPLEPKNIKFNAGAN